MSRRFSRVPSRQAGFTLVEVLIAIALMAIVSIISWRGLDNVAHLQHRLSADAAEVDNIVRMLGQMERDLALRAPDTLLTTTTGSSGSATDTGGSSSGSTTGGTATTATTISSPLPQSLRVTVTGAANGSATLEIVRSDAAIPGAWQRVVWFLDGDVLRRAVGMSVRQYPLPQVGPGAAILGGVTRLTVRGWVPGQGWIPTPFPANSPTFTGLELAAERQTPAGIERYRRVVLLQ